MLYNKYRPQFLREIVGHDMVKPLISTLISKPEIWHLVTLHGGYGVGKTSIAYMIAKGINCNCKVHDSCICIKSIDEFVDIYELDGARYSGVENIRNITKELSYPPQELKYKVCIIDEAHCISSAAFSALLKILESPQPYIKFILATTDFQSIPDTIKSRSANIELHPLSDDVIRQQINHISTLENIPITKDELDMITLSSNQSLRHGISILTLKSINNTGNIMQITGHPSIEMICKMYTAILQRNIDELNYTLNAIYKDNGQPKYILIMVMELVSHLISKSESIFSKYTGNIDSNVNIQLLSRHWELLIHHISNIKQIKRQTLETILNLLMYIKSDDDDIQIENIFNV